MSRTVWILLAVGGATFALAVAGAALLLASDDSTTTADETLALGTPPPRLELPLAGDPQALMLARRTGTVLVGFAARRRGPIQVAALDGEEAVPREELSFRLGGEPKEASSCGYACWELDAPGEGLLAVTVRGKPLRWVLPRTQVDGRPVFRRAVREMGSLRTYRYVETLTSGVGRGVESSIAIQAPNRMHLRTVDGFESILIGNSRWDFRDGRWQRTPFPGFRPTFMWDGASHAKVVDERLGREDTLIRLAVFDPQPVPAWFQLYVSERTGRIVRADMVAPSHFMQQRFHAFNAPTRIRPPQ